MTAKSGCATDRHVPVSKGGLYSEHIVQLNGAPYMNADLGTRHAERSEASQHFSWREAEENAAILHSAPLRSE
jgi:hypothetical protein